MPTATSRRRLAISGVALRAGVLPWPGGLGGDVGDPRRFWVRQGIQVVVAIALLLGVFSIWVTPDTDITTGIGLASAGLALALQQVILSPAAYFVILRGDTFGVGDRLGGVRGDVVRLGFPKTTIMEMGPPVPYDADRVAAETILLEAAHAHAVVVDADPWAALAHMRSRHASADASLDPAVYWRITDNWLELSLRFLVPHRGVREMKDVISRQVLTGSN